MTVLSESQGLTVEAFDRLLTATPVVFPWAVAVSGGSDSMALMVLCTAWARVNHRPMPMVLTVDHGLRAASATDALQVVNWASAHGLSSKILRWKDPKPHKNIQSQAREARYRLLGRFCLDHGIRSLAVAHNQDDQAETVLLRLARGSGVDGLAAMRAVAALPVPDPQFAFLRLLRPLLGVTRCSLQATLQACGQPWLTDPSNDNPRYARVRMRTALAHLAQEGIDSARLAKTAVLMDRARQALDEGASALCHRVADFDNAGYARLQAAELVAAPKELALRALAAVLGSVGGSIYRPRLARLERLYGTLQQDLDGKPEVMGRGATLAGCRIVRAKGADNYLVVREMAGLRARVHGQRQPAKLAFGDRLLWDNRFELTLTGPLGAELFDWDGEVRPLGRVGLAQAKSLQTSDAPTDDLPALVRPTLPALWVGDRLAAAPHLGIIDQDQFPQALVTGPAVKATFLGRRGLNSDKWVVPQEVGEATIS